MTSVAESDLNIQQFIKLFSRISREDEMRPFSSDIFPIEDLHYECSPDNRAMQVQNRNSKTRAFLFMHFLLEWLVGVVCLAVAQFFLHDILFAETPY